MAARYSWTKLGTFLWKSSQNCLRVLQDQEIERLGARGRFELISGLSRPLTEI